MQQLSLFDLIPRKLISRRVDPDGSVIQRNIDEVHACPGMKSWQKCEIEIHRDRESGLFMWAINHANGGYRVGAKWGKFAETRGDALEFAKDELRAKIEQNRSVYSGAVYGKTIKWLEALR